MATPSVQPSGGATSSPTPSQSTTATQSHAVESTSPKCLTRHTRQPSRRTLQSRAPLHASASPLNRSLLAGIDILTHAALEQERSHVVGQECTRLRIHHIQPVVIDQHRLLFEPITPALLADLFHNARTNLPWEWR